MPFDAAGAAQLLERAGISLNTVQGADAVQAAQRLAGSKGAVQNLVTGQGNPNLQGLEGVTTVVFISLAMPARTLQSYFRQAEGRKDIVFLLRGWVPPLFSETVGQVNSLMKGMKSPANVLVHPEAFRTYRVDQVPVVLHRRQADQGWYRVTGEISLAGAVSEIEAGRVAKIVGNTHPISEPDVIEVMEKRYAALDFEKIRRSAIQSAADRYFSGLVVQHATRSETRLFDPSITVEYDHVDPVNGNVLLKKGTRINPLEKRPFPYTVIAFDPTDPKQLEFANALLRTAQKPMVFVTRNALHEGGRTTEQVLGTRTYPINELYMQRFGISAVPAVVRQRGLQMEVTTYAGTQ
ncbi:TrbC family F-type conjugative pilus assembly protein [Cupriavidus malaysiensis]|uniref:Uncharacterized protein n=1 Tax=Cupriavidus malaysiensis TaxID=367825 RepID=A0ABM6FGW5_9BURK|nr:TrbC family F-type conjugative pilus assembly protein [Cupriavidus malaysiensis]AOZ11194.1 hypothetical protein BKK80_35160 [Cupriavidus malaysiensis]